jgi:hypothetical protein
MTRTVGISLVTEMAKTGQAGIGVSVVVNYFVTYNYYVGFEVFTASYPRRRYSL